MLRTLTGVLALLAVLTAAPLARAQAQEFGTRGEFIVSADRLVPLFSYTRIDQHALAPLATGETSASNTTTQTNLSLLWGSAPPQNGSQELFFTIPRVGFDYVAAPNVTIGGDLALYFTLGSSNSSQSETGGTTTTVSGGNGGMLLFGFAPRAGYILRMSRRVAFWLRGGFSYYTETQSSAKTAGGAFTHDGADEFALDLDPQLVITPVPHLGVTAGLTTDLPLSGEHWTKTFDGMGGSSEVSAGSSLLFFGITVGLIGYF